MSKMWALNSDLQYNQSENLYKTLPADDMIYWRNNLTLIYSNEPSLKMIDKSQKIPKTLFLQYSDDKKSVKVTENDGQYRHFESQLNGHRISAATDVTLNNKTFVYLFAGRMLCRQELNEQFVKVCDIEDIADWIDCSDITQKGDEPLTPSSSSSTSTTTVSTTATTLSSGNTPLVIIGVIVGVVFLLVVVIAVTIFLMYSKPKEQPNNWNEMSTLRLVDNKSTANLHSDIPSPQTIESKEGLNAKRSEATLNKKLDNSPSNTSFSDL